MNESETYLHRERDRLHSKKQEELSSDEKELLSKLDTWHINHFRTMLAYSSVLDTWARQQMRGFVV